MGILTQKERCIGIMLRGKYGISQDFGSGFFGFCLFGYDNPYSGIYAKYNFAGKKYDLKKNFWFASNPQTEAQQAWRDIFKNGKTAYDGLSADEKLYFKKWGAKYKMTGYNKFMSEYLKAHKG